MNDYKNIPIFLVALIFLVPTVVAPASEYSTTVDTGQSNTVIDNVVHNTTLRANGEACDVAAQCSGGYCNSGVCASSAPSGGAGVSGGAAAAVSAVTSESKAISSISAGGSETVLLTKPTELKIEKIIITAKAAVTSAQITVKESSASSLPSGTSAPLTSDKGSVLKYLEVEKLNIPDASVDKVKIEFRVEKSWVTTSNIATSTIALQRLVGTTWNKLTTTLKEETATMYIFEAESPGLSFFAITGEKKAVIQTACPSSFECCEGEVNYTDKVCTTGYECKNNKCVAIVVTPTCPVCPSPSDWSACMEEKQTRTNYKCSADTSYICQSYAEEQACKVPAKPSYTYYIIGIVVLAGIGYMIYKFYVSRQFKYSFRQR